MNFVFFMEQRNGVFFLILTLQLLSAALSYLNVHSTFKSCENILIFLSINTNHLSKEQGVNSIRSSHLSSSSSLLLLLLLLLLPNAVTIIIAAFVTAFIIASNDE